MAKKQAKRHKSPRNRCLVEDCRKSAEPKHHVCAEHVGWTVKITKPATGKARNRTAQVGRVAPSPASRVMPKYLESGSGLDPLKMAQWAIIDARSMDADSIGRVHLPESQARIDATILGLMKSEDERSQRAGAQMFRLMQEGENQRHAAEMKLRETALEAYQAGRSADLQAQMDKSESAGLGDDILGQLEATMHEIAKAAVEEAMAK